MRRLFDSQFSWPVATLALFELSLFLIGLGLALQIYPTLAQVEFDYNVVNVPLVAILAVIGYGNLFAGGLYSRDVFKLNVRLTRCLATCFSLMVVSFGFFLAVYTIFVKQNFSNIFSIVLFAACVQLFAIAVTRALFIDFFEVVGFKWRLLVLGDGAFSNKIEAWVDEHCARFAEVVRYNDAYRAQIGTQGSQMPRSVAALAVSYGFSNADLLRFASDHRIDEIVVESREDSGEQIWELLECRTNGIRLTEFSAFWERETGRVDLSTIDPAWLVFSDGFRNGRLGTAIKRSLDIVFSLFGLLITSPFLPLVALLIKLDSRGPVFYQQERIGKDGKPFQIVKFRSMCADAEHDQKPRWAVVGDTRVTRLGTILRQTRIDEIPQLWNVLKGEMSLVGPRPERPTFVSAFEEEIPFYEVRHCVRPGITGWAQINYQYGASVEDAVNKLEYDLFYVKNISMFLDLSILLQTFRIIIWRQGAR